MLWIGTETDGLNRFDKHTGRFTHILHDPNEPHSLSNNRVKSIYKDQKGRLWVGTNGGGLNQFNRETETFKHYTEKDGLPNDVIYGILEDKTGNLWLSTNWGLSKFTPPSVPPRGGNIRGVFRNYDVYDGLQSNEFNTASYFQSESGEMFFGGINGFNAFYPQDIKDNLCKPPIVITDFQIFNKSVPIGLTMGGKSILQKHISDTDEITLTYKDDVFSFEFTALSFAAPAKNKYAYQMEGFDKDWVYTDATKRLVTYTNLDPGNYIFMVNGSNQDGIWNEEGTSIKITIVPPFWSNWWFRTIGIIMLAGVVFTVFNARIRTLKNQQAAKDKFAHQLIDYQEEERKRIAAELHDALGQDLLIIKNKVLMGIHTDSKISEMKTRLNDISESTSEAIEDVRKIARNLRPYQLDRLGLSKALESILTNISKSSEIRFSYNIDNLDGIFPPDQEIHIYRILQESINNVIQHSNASETLVIIQKESNHIRLTVKDDGVGFRMEELDSKLKPIRGIGISGIRERIRILKGELEIKSNRGQGTTLSIIFPIPGDKYS